MDGLIRELLRLENAKHQALISIDASSYEAIVREQVDLLAASRRSLDVRATSVDHLLALSQLITLNTRLLHNLISTTPLFNFTENGYTAEGRIEPQVSGQRVSVKG